VRENTKGIRHGALSRSFVTSHYPFLSYRSYEITLARKNSPSSVVVYMTYIKAVLPVARVSPEATLLIELLRQFIRNRHTGHNVAFPLYPRGNGQSAAGLVNEDKNLSRQMELGRPSERNGKRLNV